MKVDPALLAAAGKENAQPKNSVPEKAHEAYVKALEEQRKREMELKAEEERCKLEEKAENSGEEEYEANRGRKEEDQKRQVSELVEDFKSEAAAAAKAKEEEQVRLEKARVAQETVRTDQEAAKEEADREAAEQVAAWCEKNGFKDMHTERKGLPTWPQFGTMLIMSGSKLPLHVAVTNKDAEMVGLMVQLGVDKTAKNSKGQTGTDLATKLNKDGLMDAILVNLR